MTDPIKRHANGSIDTAHYIAQAHMIRSQSAHAALRAANDAVTETPDRLWPFIYKIFQARKSLGEPITT